MTPDLVFWQYWAASTVSTWGTSVTAVAMPVVALTLLDASAFEVSLLTAASYAAWLVIGLPAGALVQRYPLRATQVSMDLARAVAIASVPVAWLLGGLTVVQLVAVALVVSFADVVFSVGNSTFLPRIVPKDELIRRNSIVSGTHSVSQFGGPAFAGFLIAALGPIVSIVVDAASYLVSSVVLSRLPNPGAQPRKARRTVAHDVREGIAYVARHPVMRPCVSAATAINFGCGALMSLLPVFVITGTGAPAALVGPVLATEGVGALLGAAVVSTFVRSLGSARVAVLGVAVALAGAALLPLAHGPAALVVFGAGNLVCAGGIVMFSVVTRTHRQVDSPPDMLSRVMATVRFVSWGAVPFGAVAGGAMSAWLGVSVALLVVTGSMLVAFASLLLSPVRGRRSLEATAESADLATPAGRG
jgi:predicted MFS family arabinose efflux permease